MTRRMGALVRTAAALLVAAALALAAWRWWHARAAGADGVAAPADTTQAGLRPLTLWFADDGGDSLVSEVRDAPEAESLHERLAQVVDGLARGPERRGTAVLPAGTSVLHAYLDARGELVLDLSRAFQQGFHGGSRAEELAVGSLMRSIGSNLPEVARVRLACGGEPIASLGGHLPLDQPLDPHADW